MNSSSLAVAAARRAEEDDVLVACQEAELVVDIASGELWGEVFEPLRDPEFFLQASVNAETGTVEWPNGADVAPGFLHERGVPV